MPIVGYPQVPGQIAGDRDRGARRSGRFRVICAWPGAVFVRTLSRSPGLTNGWLAPAAPTKPSTARLLKNGEAAPSVLMLERMLLKPMPPANPYRLIEEKSAVTDKPLTRSGWNT